MLLRVPGRGSAVPAFSFVIAEDARCEWIWQSDRALHSLDRQRWVRILVGALRRPDWKVIGWKYPESLPGSELW